MTKICRHLIKCKCFENCKDFGKLLFLKRKTDRIGQLSQGFSRQFGGGRKTRLRTDRSLSWVLARVRETVTLCISVKFVWDITRLRLTRNGLMRRHCFVLLQSLNLTVPKHDEATCFGTTALRLRLQTSRMCKSVWLALGFISEILFCAGDVNSCGFTISGACRSGKTPHWQNLRKM